MVCLFFSLSQLQSSRCVKTLTSFKTKNTAVVAEFFFSSALTWVVIVQLVDSTHTRHAGKEQQKTSHSSFYLVCVGELRWKCLHVGQCSLALWPARVQSKKELLRRGETIQVSHQIRNPSTNAKLVLVCRVINSQLTY